ncbi:MAG TPA: zeta toxin family protein [Thermoanaerobaculia bacterium]|nr:zeta toxin family protein [Thermoanaerobaculia bacterium]
MTAERPRIYVLAGVNGAGKSSIGGAAFRAAGADYFNPDEVARELLAERLGLTEVEANAAAWRIGRALLERAIEERLDFAFETTLGGETIPRLLAEAARSGIEVRVWYVGLASPELHVERVAARVRRGGHAIPEEIIRRRYKRSRLNLVQLMPSLAELRVYDNSADADPEAGQVPTPQLVLHLETGRIVGPEDLSQMPDWAKPIVAAALERGSG